MAESKDERLRQVLADLRSNLFDVTGTLLTSADGLALAADLPSNVDSTRIAAMAATAIGLGKRIATTLNMGTYDESVVKANEGMLYLYAAGANAVLAVMAGAGANTGLINLESRRSAKELERILG